MKFIPPDPPLVVARSGPNERARHIFAPCLHRHRTGQWLMVARWDEQGAEEGQSTNSQALFFSRDEGRNWQIAADTPLLSSQQHSSFEASSSLTHAWLLEDRKETTWLYFTVNQPYTWGSQRPNFSTGGGEIRKVEVAWDNHSWRIKGQSGIVWGVGHPLPLPDGLIEAHGRVASWNGAIEVEPRVWVMPIGGRTTFTRPRGNFEKLNRVWVLISRDDGETWPEAHFVAGSDHQCFAEPTLVKTSTPNQLVCLMRIQYDTGNQLYRVQSKDGGRTWTPPQPTGLPQTDKQGVKPYLLRRSDGSFALIQTNEHDSITRSNIAIFLTDEDGLLNDHWPVVRTLKIGNRQGWWPGCCYGWLTENTAGQLVAAYTCEDKTGGRLCLSTLDTSVVPSLDTLEPNGVADELGDDQPYATTMEETGRLAIRFISTRSRALAPSFGTLDLKTGGTLSFAVMVRSAPSKEDFQAIRLFSHNGRQEETALVLRSGDWYLRSADKTPKLSWPINHRHWQKIEIRFSTQEGIVINLMEAGPPGAAKVPLKHPLTTLYFGGGNQREACDVLIADFQCLPNS